MEKRKQTTISAFMTKKPKTNSDPNEPSSIPSTSSSSSIPDSDKPVQEKTNDVSDSMRISSETQVSSFEGMDIATVKNISISNLDQHFINILDNVWTPENTFQFPKACTDNKSKKSHRSFQSGWLKKYNWLAYSKIEDAAFCKYCMLFAVKSVGHHQGQGLGALVKTGFRLWKHALEMFNNHAKAKYHCEALIRAQNLREITVGNIVAIDKQLNRAEHEERLNNRKKLVPIIKTIILCGKQGLALRGHRDYGPIDLSQKPEINEGNFRAFLRERVDAGDSVLENHLRHPAKNAMYTSWNIQNQLIECCGAMIQKNILKKVNAAKFFSVLADEATDISSTQQMSICVRYVDETDFKICEDFVCFVPLTSATGEALATEITTQLKKLGFDTNNIRGQGYDGAAAMSGKVNGVQAHILRENPKALYVHCVAHCLNLAITDSCNIKDIRNCMGTLEKVCVFFNYPKRQLVLQKCIEELCPESRKEKLKKMCPTRWVQRHDSVIVFLELFNSIYKALNTVTDWNNKDVSTEANILQSAISASSFLVSLYILEYIFSYSILLSRFLQSENIDLALAINHTYKLKEKLQDIRNNAENEFRNLFQKVESKCRELDTTLNMPRIVGHQTNRCNIQCTTVEEYYRISVFIPFLDNFITQISNRFLKHKDVLSGFMCLFNLDKSNDYTENLKNLFAFYEKDLAENEAFINEQLLLSEYTLWQTESSQKGNNRTTAIEALSRCNKNIYPNIYTLLKLFATLPVSTCTTERSNSTLKRLKSYIRNTMTENRLVGLALMNIHYSFTFDIEEVLNLFAEKSRKLKLNVKL